MRRRLYQIGLSLMMIGLVIGLIAVALPTEIGITYAVGNDNLPLPGNQNNIPKAIAEDARQTASSLFGSHQ